MVVTIGIHDEKFAAAFAERDYFAVRRPNWMFIQARFEGEPRLVVTIGIHDETLAVAISITLEGDFTL